LKLGLRATEIAFLQCAHAGCIGGLGLRAGLGLFRGTSRTESQHQKRQTHGSERAISYCGTQLILRDWMNRSDLRKAIAWNQTSTILRHPPNLESKPLIEFRIER
jgi:hypothetical protein